MLKWFIVGAGIGCNAAASVLIKLAMTPPRKFPSPADPLAAITNWPLWVGLVLYGGAFLLYAAALARLPLNITHPVMTAGAVATVAVLSLALFREPFPWTRGLGILLVMGGMFLVTYKAA